MNFQQITQSLLEGKKIRRTCWETNHYWNLIDNQLLNSAGEKPMINSSQLKAIDWEVFDNNVFDKSESNLTIQVIKDAQPTADNGVQGVFMDDHTLMVSWVIFCSVWFANIYDLIIGKWFFVSNFSLLFWNFMAILSFVYVFLNKKSMEKNGK